MKLLVLAVFAFCSLSAFSADLRSTLRDIEVTRNAKCVQKSVGFKFCSGLSQSYPNTYEYQRERREAEALRVCTYTIRYNCISNSGDFDLRVQVRETRNTTTVIEIE